MSMSRSITRQVSHGGIAAIAALMLAACDEPTTAPLPQSSASSVLSVARAPRDIPNSVKYRDRGRRPATGRSGSATLTVSALLGMNGMTDVGIEAGSLAGTGQPMLAKVQLAGYAPTGEHLFTLNDNGLSVASTTMSLAGLARQGRVRVHGNVRGVDGPRTNVVIVEQPVALRPDIAVMDLQAPTEVWTQTPTIVSAVLREMNGDVGARTSCVLDLDGTPVDSAANVWVDAGGTISCAFAVLLTEFGSHTLTVRAANVRPGDWNVANNAASVTVTVGRELPLSYRANVSEDSVITWRLYWHNFTTGGGVDISRERDSSSTMGRRQLASITAFTVEPIDFPEQPVRDLQLAQRTGSTTVHSAAYPELPADQITSGPNWVSGCVTRSEGAIVATVTLCSRRETNAGVITSYTSITYDWHAGDVTYSSIGYSYLRCSGCMPHSYSWNTITPSVDGQLVEFGSDYSFDVAFRSGGTRFSTNPVLTISAFHTNYQAPTTCQSMWTVYPPIGKYGFLEWCSGMGDEHWRKSGSVSMP